MRLSGETLQALDREAAGLKDRNHVGYLAEALNASHARDADLHAPLRLLAALWGTPYAGRPQQKAALNDVGVWLERNTRESKDLEELRQRIGWMKRLVGQGGHGGHHKAPNADTRRRFGNQVPPPPVARVTQPTLEKRPEPPKREQEDHGPKRPEAPTGLPPSFAAHFVGFLAARDVFKRHKDRLKKKKAPREQRLPLQPDDPTLEALAAGLVCVTTETEGFVEYFRAVEDNGGAQVPMVVEGVEGGRALRIRPGE